MKTYKNDIPFKREDRLFKTNIYQQDEAEQFIHFFQQFIDSIQNENTINLMNLMAESEHLKDIELNGDLPLIAYSSDITTCLMKSIQLNFLNNLFYPVLTIFYNIYIYRREYNILRVLNSDLCASLWRCFFYTQGDNQKILIDCLFGIAKISKEHMNFVFMNVNYEEFCAILNNSKIDDSARFSSEWCLFSVENLIYTFKNSLDIFIVLIIRVFYLYENYPNLISKDSLLKSIKAFNDFSREMHNINFIKKISDGYDIQHFIIDSFLYYNDPDIVYNSIRLISTLCNCKAKIRTKAKNGETKTQTMHIKFNIVIFKNEKNGNNTIVTHKNNFFQIVSFFFDDNLYNNDYMYSDIPGSLCNIVSNFSKQILEKDKNWMELRKMFPKNPLYFTPFHILMEKQVLFKIKDIFENKNYESQVNACKLINIMLEGPFGFAIQILNLGIIDYISKFLYSDIFQIIRVACKFFKLLCEIQSVNSINYPIQQDLITFQIYESLENLILMENEQISSIAQYTLNLIKQTFFQEG